MQRAAFAILTHPTLERFRARIYYPLVVAIMAFGMASVWILVHSILGLLAGTWQIDPLPFLVVAIFPPIYILLDLTGRISGYRPFVAEWSDLSVEQVDQLLENITKNATDVGFQVCWRKATSGVVAVLNLGLETRAINGGQNFPTRLSLFFRRRGENRFSAVMKIGIRTVCFWDSGERVSCGRYGSYLSEMIRLENPEILPGKVSWKDSTGAPVPTMTLTK